MNGRASGTRNRLPVLVVLACAAVVSALVTERAVAQSGLAVLSAGEYRTWWTLETAPRRWAGGLPIVQDAVTWHAAAPGMDWGEALLAGPGEARRTRLVLVRVDPAGYEFRLDIAVRYDGDGNQWSIDSTSTPAVLAFNAGQFFGLTPWGLLVHGGRELRPAGRGPLAMTVAFAGNGAAAWLDDASPIPWLQGAAMPAEAFQSYPALLVRDGVVPPQILQPHPDLHWGHRDSRLAIGQLRDGHILIALTRFNGLGSALEVLPLGLTVPEMSAVMGALGCRAAVMLDGGLSGQVMVRDRAGEVHRWPGTRKVPVGIVVVPRPRSPT